MPGSELTRARQLYLDVMEKILVNVIYNDPPNDHWSGGVFDPEKRSKGRDWPSEAHSMIGLARMHNTRTLSERVILDGIPGDFIETGVWRGGASIMIKAVLAAYGSNRSIICADSFAGLPAPSTDFPQDADLDLHTHTQLAISKETVLGNFQKYDLLDDQVEILEGWFRDTLPTISGRNFSLLRLDGDMYESTYQALVSLYTNLSEGGFIIVDDYWDFHQCRDAVKDFFDSIGTFFSPNEIDGAGVWWRKPYELGA